MILLVVVHAERSTFWGSSTIVIYSSKTLSIWPTGRTVCDIRSRRLHLKLPKENVRIRNVDDHGHDTSGRVKIKYNLSARDSKNSQTQKALTKWSHRASTGSLQVKHELLRG